MTADVIARCANAASELGMAFAGEPIDRVMVALRKSRRRLARQLTPVMGEQNAVLLANEFVKAVLATKRDIELAAGASKQRHSI